MMCSCRLEHNSNDSPLVDNNDGEKDTSTIITTDATTGKTTNPLAGVWLDQESNTLKGGKTLYIFNGDYAVYFLVKGVYGVEFFFQGTYEITSDNEVIIKGYDEDNEYTEETLNFFLSDGKLVLDNDLILNPFSSSTSSSSSIVGTWKECDGKSFHIEIDTLMAEIDHITFYSDGSYATSSTTFYGPYSIVQGGAAVQLFSPNGKNEELYKIKHLGCGLMIFEVSDTVTAYKSYVLQRVESN